LTNKIISDSLGSTFTLGVPVWLRVFDIQPFEPEIVNTSVGNMYTYIEEILGLMALATSIIGLLPQVYKTYITKSAHDISMIMLINYFVCSVSWIGYGLCQGSLFVILSNIAGFIISVILIAQKRYYDTTA
jgi:MtN3 and saliva related transmembrane protein